jgi:hypothetical protein
VTIPHDSLSRILGKTRDYARLERPDAPLSVLYGGAQLFTDQTFAKLGKLATVAFGEHIRHDDDVCAIVGEELRPLAGTLRERVAEKLATRPLEDVRVDFEDGYGVRSAADEDADASRVGQVLGAISRGAPRWLGIRVKAFDRATGARAARTLERVFEGLSKDTLPDGFVVTLPKVQRTDDVRAFVELLGLLEEDRSLQSGSIGLELMIETPSALVSASGAFAIPELLDAGAGRVTSLHLGAYDLLSSCDVGASAQSLGHPLCTAARSLMVLSANGRARVADGATTRLPLPKHRGGNLEDDALHENHVAILEAFREHAQNVTAAHRLGIHQGWDLHPAQLVARYLATSAYYLGSLATSAARLRGFVEQAARATAAGQTFDDAATAEGLVAFFARGLSSGMLREEDTRATGLTPHEIRARDFAGMVARREPRSSGAT